MAAGRGGMFICSKLGQNRDGSQDICQDTESNLGPFAGFRLKLSTCKLYFRFVLNKLESRYAVCSVCSAVQLFSYSFYYFEEILTSY